MRKAGPRLGNFPKSYNVLWPQRKGFLDSIVSKHLEQVLCLNAFLRDLVEFKKQVWLRWSTECLVNIKKRSKRLHSLWTEVQLLELGTLSTCTSNAPACWIGGGRQSFPSPFASRSLKARWTQFPTVAQENQILNWNMDSPGGSCISKCLRTTA